MITTINHVTMALMNLSAVDRTAIEQLGLEGMSFEDLMQIDYKPECIYAKSLKAIRPNKILEDSGNRLVFKISPGTVITLYQKAGSYPFCTMQFSDTVFFTSTYDTVGKTCIITSKNSQPKIVKYDEHNNCTEEWIGDFQYVLREYSAKGELSKVFLDGELSVEHRVLYSDPDGNHKAETKYAQRYASRYIELTKNSKYVINQPANRFSRAVFDEEEGYLKSFTTSKHHVYYADDKFSGTLDTDEYTGDSWRVVDGKYMDSDCSYVLVEGYDWEVKPKAFYNMEYNEGFRLTLRFKGTKKVKQIVDAGNIVYIYDGPTDFEYKGDSQDEG